MLDDFPADGQTQARPLRFIGHRIAALAEAFENNTLVSFWNARTIVMHGQSHQAILLLQTDRHQARHRWYELDGIRQQIDDDLLDPIPIDIDPYRTLPFRKLKNKHCATFTKELRQ